MTALATSSRQARRKLRTATAILDAGERLFLERGYRATTVEQLAEEADVALGSLYAHFDGKEGVYAGLVDRALEFDKRYCDEGWESGSSPFERLVGLSEGYLRFAREHPGHFRVFRFPPDGGPTDGPADGAARRVAERVASEVDRMAGALDEAAAEGVLRPLDAPAAAVFLWAAWDGVIAAHLLPTNMGLTESQFESVLAIAREVLIRGLVPPEGAAA